MPDEPAFPPGRQPRAKPWLRRAIRPRPANVIVPADEPPLLQLEIYPGMILLTRRSRHHGCISYPVDPVALVQVLGQLPMGSGLLPAQTIGYGLRNGTPFFVQYVPPRHIRLRTEQQVYSWPMPPPTLPETDLLALQETVTAIPVPDSIVEALATLRKDLTGKGMSASDRRWRQCLVLLQASALLEGRGLVEEDDLLVLKHSLWTTPDQCQEIGRLAARLANPLNARAVELGDQADTVHQTTMQAQRGATTDEAKMQAAVEGASKLKAIVTQLTHLREQADAQGRTTTRIERVAGQVTDMRRQVAELVL